MAKTAAMVQAKVVKGAGAGAVGDLSCPDIFACFDPEIKFGSHKEMVGSLEGYQAEHIIPTSAFHVLGRKGDRMPDCDAYSTSSALTFMVRDGQSEGQTHKLLTDPMREFSQANDLANNGKGRQAPLKEWLQKYEDGATDALRNAKEPRTIVPERKDLDVNALTAAAAKCIRKEAEAAFKDMGIDPNTALRNPWKATKKQRAELLKQNGGAGEIL